MFVALPRLAQALKHLNRNPFEVTIKNPNHNGLHHIFDKKTLVLDLWLSKIIHNHGSVRGVGYHLQQRRH